MFFKDRFIFFFCVPHPHPIPPALEILGRNNETCCFIFHTVWSGGCRQLTNDSRRTENAVLKLCSSSALTVLMDLSDRKQMMACH